MNDESKLCYNCTRNHTTALFSDTLLLAGKRGCMLLLAIGRPKYALADHDFNNYIPQCFRELVHF